jgi:hypothetical protein
MKFCPECGYQFTAGTEKFCPNCGHNLKEGRRVETNRKDSSIHIANSRGDVIGVGVSGSGHIIGKDIINKSNVRNALNKVEEKYDKETSEALVKVAEFIEKSGDPAAGVSFNNFTEELIKPEPDKSKLKSFWSGLEKALPTIAQVAAKIVPLFV